MRLKLLFIALIVTVAYSPTLVLGQQLDEYGLPVAPTVQGHKCFNPDTGAPEPCNDGSNSPQSSQPNNQPAPENTVAPTNTVVPTKKAVSVDKIAVPNPRAVVVGRIESLRGTVKVEQPDGSWKEVGKDYNIRLYDHIDTGNDGHLVIRLADDTEFTLGSRGEMIIDEFVYDPKNADKLTINLLKGIFRFVTGKLAGPHKEDIRIKLAVGTLGRRGTDFILSYDPDTTTAVVSLNEGKVDITPKSTNQKQEFDAPQTIIFDATGIKNTSSLSPEKWASLLDEVGSVGETESGETSIVPLLWLIGIIASRIFYFQIDRKKKENIMITLLSIPAYL